MSGRAEEDLRVEFAGRTADHRVQPDVPDRRTGFAAFGAGDVRLHHAQPASGVAPGTARMMEVPADAARSRRLETDYVYLLMPVRLPG